MAYSKIESGVREIAASDYAATNAETKTKLFNQLTKQIFENRIIDLLNVNNSMFSNFLVEPVRFGEGWREITLALANVEPYSTNPDKRYAKTRNLLKDYVQEHKKTIRDLVRLTYNRLETQEYFKDLESMDKLINLTVKRITDTLALRNYEFIKVLFNGENGIGKLYTLDLTSEMYKLAIEWNKLIKNEITYTVASGESAILNLVKKVKTTINEMTLEPTDRFHLDTTITGFPVSTTPSDLVLVISQESLNEWNEFVSKEQRNPDFYKLPDIEIITLPIEKGTAYIFQKGAIQIAPHFEEQYTEFFPITLDTDIIHHQQFKYGLSKIHNFVKIKKA